MEYHCEILLRRVPYLSKFILKGRKCYCKEEFFFYLQRTAKTSKYTEHFLQENPRVDLLIFTVSGYEKIVFQSMKAVYKTMEEHQDL